MTTSPARASAGRPEAVDPVRLGPLPQPALDGEIERLVALGATMAWEEAFPAEMAATDRNVVLRDRRGTSSASAGARAVDVSRC